MQADPTHKTTAPADEPTLLGAQQNAVRLTAVAATRRWQSECAASWQRLTELAVALLGVQASFVAVVEADCDVYPAHHGLPGFLGVPARLEGRTFCQHAVALDSMLVIDDTWAEGTWRAVPTVDSLGVRAYVGVPLRVAGVPVGNFCAVDTVPRQWDALTLETMAALASCAERELRLHAALEHAQAEAERARGLVRDREALVAAVSHDLRTPLQAAVLVARLLEDRAAPDDGPLVERLVLATTMMRGLINDLVSDRLLAPSVRAPRPTTAGALLADVAQLMLPVADRARVALHCEAGPDDTAALLVDQAELLRALANLVGNALKYTPTGGQVHLVAQRDGDTVFLRVTDTGPGMDADALHQAFEPGWQGANGVALGDGAGLGLSIVRTLLERNHGSVSLHCRAGQGLTAELRLPRYKG